MSTLSLKFDGIDEIVEIELDSTVNAEFFKNYLLEFKKPADVIWYPKSLKENTDDFLNKAIRARELFKFNWDLDNLTQDNFNLWHRDIETFDLSKHPPWSQEKGDFFILLHNALHCAENQIGFSDRDTIKIKWFAKSIPWPELPIFVPLSDLGIGDIITDYPHVGKSPWVSYQNNDTTNLTQSCRLPDACPPGFAIWLGTTVRNQQQIKNDQQKLINWYQQNIDQLGELFTQDQMLTYNGEHRVGQIKNIEQLSLLKTANLTSVSVIK
jgi:hypothetical protein